MICNERIIENLNSLSGITPAADVDREEIEKQRIQIPNILISLADRTLSISKRTTCTVCGFHPGKSGTKYFNAPIG